MKEAIHKTQVNLMRDEINNALKTALKMQDKKTSGAIRLILAALKDRDIAMRGQGNHDGMSDQDILSMLQTMIKQRQESMKLYEQGGRLDLVEQEKEEINIIKRFLPQQLSEDEVSNVIDQLIQETEATSPKDMGKIMSRLRESYTGVMDFGKASAIIKSKLS